MFENSGSNSGHPSQCPSGAVCAGSGEDLMHFSGKPLSQVLTAKSVLRFADVVPGGIMRSTVTNLSLIKSWSFHSHQIVKNLCDAIEI